MKTTQNRRYQRTSRPYFKHSSCVKPSNKLKKLIRDTVSNSSAPLVSYPRTDPPAFKRDRTWTRKVRVEINSTATGVSFKNIADIESAYYGVSGPRWQGLKIKSATIYALETVDTLQVAFTGGSNGAQTATTSFQDIADRNHRACIKIIYPPTVTRQTVGATIDTLEFSAGSVDFIDFIVQFD